MGEEDEIEEFEEEEEDKKNYLNIPSDVYEKELSKIKSNPRKYICDYMEENLLHVGKKAFNLICLMPCSLIIPSIPFGSTEIRANINTFILGSPASGKSTLCKKFSKFSYYSMSGKSISARRLIEKIVNQNGMFSLSIDDFSNVMDQPDGYETVKILEGAIGDEKIVSHENMKYTNRTKTQATAIICGTWTDLKKYSGYLKGGLLSRMSLLFLSINQKQREEIADFINRNIGNVEKSNESMIKEQIILDYYKILLDIQAKKNKSIPQVEGYKLDDNMKGMALSSWKSLTGKYANDINGDFKREFHDFYRFLISHAFLNVFNRKIVKGILYPEKEDYDFALSLMKETLGNKILLIQSRIILPDIDSPMKLMKWMDTNIKEDVKNILLNLSPYGKMVSAQISNNPQEKK